MESLGNMPKEIQKRILGEINGKISEEILKDDFPKIPLKKSPTEPYETRKKSLQESSRTNLGRNTSKNAGGVPEGTPRRNPGREQ